MCSLPIASNVLHPDRNPTTLPEGLQYCYEGANLVGFTNDYSMMLARGEFTRTSLHSQTSSEVPTAAVLVASVSPSSFP